MYNDIYEHYEYLKNERIIISTETSDFLEFNLTVVNEFIDWNEINNEFEKNKIVIVDNLLKEEYVDRLRKYMLCLNIRHDIYNDYGAVNFSKEGLWFDLLEKISSQLKEKLKFLSNLNYNRSWSFIYNNEGNGPGPHFDPGSIVTGNLWVTPNDSINIDDKHNGIEIWNCLHPNCNTSTDQSLSAKFFDDINNSQMIKKNTVNYKCNRIVFFDGRYIHRSQPVSTKPGYKNRKINYTFLYN